MEKNLKFFNRQIFDNFKYKLSQRKGNISYYVCTHYSSGTCRARGVLKNDTFNVTINHTHKPNIKELKQDAFKRALFWAVINTNDKYRQIYDRICVDHQCAAIYLTFARIENSMLKWRQMFLPPPVHTLFSYVQTINSNNWKHLKKYRNGTMDISFVIAEDQSHSVIFMDPNFVRKIAVTGYFYLDATFKIVPTSVGALQFLTILSRKYDTAIPCIWVLMERKTRLAYKSVFLQIRRQIPEFYIEEAMIDYEKALKRALLQVFQNILLRGCLFHHKQALYKKALKCRLKNVLKLNADAQHLLALIMSLPLLPANVIKDTYQEILRPLSPYLKRTFQSFFDYYEREWLLKVKPEMFSVYMQMNRTNNCLEAYHKTLKQKCGVHPTMWAFSRNIMNVQESCRMNLESLQRGLIVRRPPKRTTTMSQELLCNAWNIYNQPNGFTPMQFLEHTLSFQANTVEAYSALYDI